MAAPQVVSNLRTLVALPLLCSAFIEGLLHCRIAQQWVWVMLCCPIPYPIVSWSCVALLCPTPRISLLTMYQLSCTIVIRTSSVTGCDCKESSSVGFPPHSTSSEHSQTLCSCYCAFLCIVLCYIQRTLEPLSMILCHNTVKYVISTLRVMMK